ncbi:MAG: hypothetical protein RL326_586 [Pseudomonadota bacterium]
MTKTEGENRTKPDRTDRAADTSPEQTAASQSLDGKTTRGDRERAMEILRERHTHGAISFDAMMRESHRIVPPDHPTHQRLQSTLEQAAEMLGLGGTPVKLVIFARYPQLSLEDISFDPSRVNAYLPEAFVNPVTGTVYLNTALLEALKYDPQKINSVMYHELAHLVLTRGIMEELAQYVSDPLGVSLRDYDVEYHCDRVAALIASKRGEDPRSIGQALETIEAAERDLLSRTRVPLARAPVDELPLLSSHPATPRRIRANERLSHQLPVPAVGATSAPPLDEIKTKALPITRPYGNLHKIENTFGNTAESLATGESFRGDGRPLKLKLSKDDYHAWCEPLEKDRDNELIPDRIRDLLKDPSIERVSDWLREFAELADEQTETLGQVVDEFLDELEGVSLEEVTRLLEKINPSRIIENYDEPSQTAIQDSPLPFCLSPLLNRYLELKSEQGASSLDSLKALVEMAREQELTFGTSVIFSAREVEALAYDICRNGTDSEHKELVDIISKNLALREALVFTKGSARVPPSGTPSQTSELLEPLLAKYSPLRVEKSEDKLLKYSMCVDIIPLHKDDAIEQPTVLRRVPGAEFAVEILHRPGGAVPIMMIQIGDKPLSDENIESIREAFRSRFTDQFQAKLYSQDISNTLDNILESVAIQAPKLLELSVPAREELETFMTTQLAAEYAESVTTTSEARRAGRELYHTKIRDIFVATSIERQIHDIGDDETTVAWIGPERSTYSTTSYARAESSSFELFQASLLFNALYRATFDTMTPSASKAELLLTKFPLKVLERDQLLCQALGYPALDCLNDMAAVETRITSETDIQVLHILREGLKNQGLAQVAEARLYELCAQDRASFLAHPAIVALRPTILAGLAEKVQEIAAQDEKLLAILSTFTQPSRQRDKHLTEFIDRANSQSLKEGLGALLVDPIVSQVSPNIDRGSRVSLDTVLSLLPHLSPYDKAQALLYFMGSRNFESPTATWLLDGHDTKTTLAGLQKELTLRAPKDKYLEGEWASIINRAKERVRHKFELPDCLVRAQKTFGIAVTTAENLQTSLLNERGITDLLTTVLYGDSGIVHDAKVRKEFFLLAGRTLVETSERLQTLEPERRKALAKFVAFAFEQCPSEKLPTVIMRVWEATKGDAEQLPSVLTSILTGLGPAFVKFGQKLATLNIDADYKAACRQLSSENKEVDSTLFYHNTEALFGRPTFDPERSGRKLGEGSMAATFKALFEGESEPMAIKMIQPSIEREIESDCAYIHKLVEYINTHKPFGSLALPKNTATVIRYQLQRQIDTELEIANSKALSAALRSSTPEVLFRVAKIHDRLSPRGVIAAEFLPGYELDKPEIAMQGHSSVAIRNEVGLETLRLLLTAPVYQSDVNLGNFGVLKNPTSGEIVTTDGRPTVVWYDAGAVEQISSEDQKLLLTIIKSAMTDPSSLPKQLSKLVKNAEEGGPVLARICEELKEEWTGRGSFTPNVIKERFERFFDKVGEAGLEIEERWLIVANTISMTAPLLEGVSPDRLKNLVVDALKHHKMLTLAERATLKAASWFS